jgi:hypothetical protein
MKWRGSKFAAKAHPLKQRAAAPRVDPNSSPLPRRVRYTSVYYHKRAVLLWRICLLTLPLDLVLLPASLRIDPTFWQGSTAILTLVTLGFIARDKLLDLAAQIRSALDKFRKTSRRYSWIAVALFFACAMAEMALKLHAHPFLSSGLLPVLLAVLAFAVVAFQAVRAIRKQIKENSEHVTRLVTDRIYWVEHVNFQIFVLSIIPIISARLVSITNIFALQGDRLAAWRVIPFGVLALLLLIAAHPSREHFVIQCKRCGFWTSRALKGLLFCPKCNTQAFQKIALEDEDSELGSVKK